MLGKIDGAGYTNMAMDELRIWNHARTGTGIAGIVNCEIPATASGLLANYHFNQGVAGDDNTGLTTLRYTKYIIYF